MREKKRRRKRNKENQKKKKNGDRRKETKLMRKKRKRKKMYETKKKPSNKGTVNLSRRIIIRLTDLLRLLEKPFPSWLTSPASPSLDCMTMRTSIISNQALHSQN